jgi:hypothetical protein
MTALNKQALREYYSPQPVPKCHICGAEMTVQRMSAIRITYGCTGETYDDKGCHYATGRSIADDHYEQSRVTVVDVSDPDVLAMLDELEATESKCRELAADNEKAMESLKQADAAVKLAHEKFSALAAENSALKNPDNWLSQSDYGYEAAEVATQNGATEDESLRAGMLAIINRIETPATDAFLAEMQAQGVEMAIGHIEQTICPNHETILNEFAAQLRKGASL